MNLEETNRKDQLLRRKGEARSYRKHGHGHFIVKNGNRGGYYNTLY